jgi:ketosteroid isomerase-like protein
MIASLLCAVLIAVFSGVPVPPSDLTQEFRQRDQALLDAIAPGDVKVWEAALAEDAVYVDENGAIINRADFLKQLTPLPAGASGTLVISAYSAHQSRDVVTVVHTDDEQELYHGQHLTAQYLMTETWQKQNGAWKLLLVHAYSVLREPKAIVLPVAELDSYAGHYSAADDLNYTIRRDGDHLAGEREGRPATVLNAEVRDVFFVSGQLRTRKIFERDTAGKIAGFVDRREGSDLVWKRLP